MKTRTPRRHFLQGLSGLIALPVLESLMPRSAWAAGITAPVRYACLYVPNGTIGFEWKPSGSGATYTMPSIAQAALTPVRGDFQWIAGLGNTATGGGGGHEDFAGSFLTQKGIDGNAVPGAAVSIDQLMAAKATSRLKSLTLVHSGQATGCCESLWLNVISYSSATTPSARLSDPAAAFDLLFPNGGTSSATGPSSSQLVIARKKSILDYSLAQQARLAKTLSSADNQRLQQYLDSVRQVEQGLVATAPTPAAPVCAPGTRPAAKPTNFQVEQQAMLDLIALAFQCDQTRIITYMMDYEFGSRNLGIAGVGAGHHDISHYGDPNGSVAAQFRLVQQYYAGRFAYLLNRLKTLPDVDGKTVLDNSAILFGWGFRDTNASNAVHASDNIPLLLGGRAGGQLTPGKLVTPGNVPLANLHRTLANIAGYSSPEIDGFAQNSGLISGL